ncbi:ABC transporter ATP-binding protein [Methylobacterium sp. WL8]|uniref:ABC transporter ATP-binding protein n=1 Tax=Methylobacterium sp. WL8 TaxID=2603899 RepID=UPI00165067BC|nr:ABC transporter ATP-binding protein [Methylobacterium sp. WL8]
MDDRDFSPTGRPNALDFEDVAIAFPLKGGRRYVAVEGIDLAVAPGEFVAVVGPTGSGKSTLLNAAAGLLKPASGRVAAFGAPLRGLNGRAGYLFQSDALMPWKTALDNVAVALEPKGVPRAAARAGAGEWLGRVGLATFADRYPHTLSGGQRKRVALAQVLIRDPEILLMDEPFGPLDAQTRQIMGNLLLDLWAADRKAVLFVTHDLEEAIGLADRVVVLSAGPAARVVGDFPVALTRPRDIAEIRLDLQFHALYQRIWSCLRVEVSRAYANGPA